MIVEDLLQGSPQWLAMRCGIPTASRLRDILPLKRGGESQARRDYKAEIVCEILTNKTAEHFVSPAMQWGLDNEMLAREAYANAMDVEVGQIGFALHDTITKFGASPDGVIGDDGLLEIKCPTTATHLEYIIGGVVPEEYRPQMYGQMACMPERQWNDFVSYDPRMPKKYRLFVRRLTRDEGNIAALEGEVVKFNAEIALMLEELAKAKLREIGA